MSSRGETGRVTLSTAWLEWWVASASHELMLFASVGILLIGLDDLLFDAMWFATRRRRSHLSAAPPINGRFAVLIPAWDEAQVLPAMLRRTLAAWDGEDVRLYVGCYPNDMATLLAVSPLAKCDPRLRIVINAHAGPTTKGDNLNQLWAALCADERSEDIRFAAVVLHDAEDHVHPEEIALYRRHLGPNAMVQIPVVPTVARGSRWIGGHYADEFAEAHSKELVVRSRLGLPLPSAGVGCALTRSALDMLASGRGGAGPFRGDSLTEDYEVGMAIGVYGCRAVFVDATGSAGDRIVSRGSFPDRIDTAVRQKARWVAGIALAGWDHLGWRGARSVAADGHRVRRWLLRWMLWRDRRAPLAALILLAVYAALLMTGANWAGQGLLGWPAVQFGDAMRLLIIANALMLGWRTLLRVHFTGRCYGSREAVFAVPRALIANLIAILAVRRAIILYCRMRRSGEVVWDKTEHLDFELRFDDASVREAAR